jgi:hypothetical protein
MADPFAIRRQHTAQARGIAIAAAAEDCRYIGTIANVCKVLPAGRPQWQAGVMFTIEHEFDSTVITLVDEGGAPLTEDVTINSFAECVTVEQYDPRTDSVQKITLSHLQVRDLAAALDLPEGVYRLVGGEDGED